MVQSSPLQLSETMFGESRNIYALIVTHASQRLHKLVLDHLGVRSIAVVIGGSMGGMAVLEWSLCTAPGYVRHIIPIATSARHSAWCISWGEAQRQSIYSDPAYKGGYYALDEQPRNGLSAARMCALLTYRSRDSFIATLSRRFFLCRLGGDTTLSRLSIK